jgi:hypothetical protein
LALGGQEICSGRVKQNITPNLFFIAFCILLSSFLLQLHKYKKRTLLLSTLFEETAEKEHDTTVAFPVTRSTSPRPLLEGSLSDARHTPTGTAYVGVGLQN